MYYVDWQGAGAAIAARASPGARVLTRHSDVAFTSRRLQHALRFEETSPTDWRRTVAQLHARYLVVPGTLFGRLFPAEALSGDPVYTLVPVHEAGDARVLEVRPNRTGTVSAESAVSEADVEACRQAAARFPHRADLRVRRAELLGERGRVQEAVALLRGSSGATVRDRLALGELLLRAEAPSEALAAFREAAALPEADLLSRRIRRGITRAEEAMQAGGRDSLDSLLARAHFSLEVLRVGDALADAERARSLAPGHPEVLWLHGVLLQRLGRVDEAEQAFQAARLAGHPDAARKLRLLQLVRQPPSMELALALLEDGTPGHALDVLERAADAPQHRQLLADLYLFYAEPARAAPLYRSVLQASPGDPRASRGLAACEQLRLGPSSLR
jgi:Flp pilus assembly protein TadD